MLRPFNNPSMHISHILIYLSIYLYLNKIVCMCVCVGVCECAMLQENGTTYSYQISYEDSRTPEYVHLKLGFSIFFFFQFFNNFLFFLYFTIKFEKKLRLLQFFLFVCLKGLLFTQVLLFISMPCENLKFVCLSISIFL